MAKSASVAVKVRPAVTVEAEAPPPASRIVKRVPRVDPTRVEDARKPAGVYRVIHGVVELPLPPEAWRNSNGTEKPEAPKTERAIMGDEIWLSEDDATKLVAQDIVEPLDTRPSRVGKVFTPPKPVGQVPAPSR